MRRRKYRYKPRKTRRNPKRLYHLNTTLHAYEEDIILRAMIEGCEPTNHILLGRAFPDRFNVRLLRDRFKSMELRQDIAATSVQLVMRTDSDERIPPFSWLKRSVSMHTYEPVYGPHFAYPVADDEIFGWHIDKARSVKAISRFRRRPAYKRTGVQS